MLLVGFLLPLAFDVKKFGDQGDSTFQVVLVIMSLASAGLYLLLELFSPDIRNAGSRLRTYAAVWWIYIVFSPLPVLLWEGDPVHYLKVLLPFILFGTGLVVMAAAERRRVDPSAVLDKLVWAALVSTIWRAIYATAIGGLSVETIRWQVLGPGVPFLIGYGLGCLYLRRHRTLAAIALVTGLITALLSITRSYIATTALVLVGLLIVDARRRSVLGAVRSGSKLLTMLVLAVLVAAAVTGAVRPDFFDVWVHRMSHLKPQDGLDITLVTRLAEYRGQISALTHSAATLLVGNGIGANYTGDAGVLQVLSLDVPNAPQWFAGHSTWVYPFFASGIVLGAFVPLVLLGVLIRGFAAASTSVARGGSSDAVLAFAVLLAYLGQSFTANLFHERYTGVILSVVAGASLTYAGRSRKSRARPQVLVPNRE